VVWAILELFTKGQRQQSSNNLP